MTEVAVEESAEGVEAAAPPAELTFGVVVDEKYTLEAPLSPSLRVWKAKRKRGRRVAIKFLAPAPDMAAWRADMAAIAPLSTPYVARTLEIAAWGGWAYVVMPLIEGVSLRSQISRAARDENARKHLRKILAGVVALHRAGIVHGELTPDNVILSRRVPVLVGFGRLRGAPPSPATYVAPEVAAGAAPTLRSDVWQLGLLCHEVLAGGLPLSAELRLAREAEVTWPRSARVIQQCLARAPEERYADARAVEKAFGRSRGKQLLVRWAIAFGIIAAIVGTAIQGYYADRRTAERAASPIDAHTVPLVGQKGTGTPNAVALSPYGTQLAYTTDHDELVVGGVEGAAFSLRPSVRPPDAAAQMAILQMYSDDSVAIRTFVPASGIGEVYRFAHDGKRSLVVADAPNGVYSFSPTGRIARGTANGLYVDDEHIVTTTHPVVAVAWSPSGLRLAYLVEVSAHKSGDPVVAGELRDVYPSGHYDTLLASFDIDARTTPFVGWRSAKSIVASAPNALFVADVFRHKATMRLTTKQRIDGGAASTDACVILAGGQLLRVDGL